jgi:hypothetical protein
MALQPNTEFPGQSAAPDANYPGGSAVNVSTAGAGDGFPLFDTWVNDIFGFLQSLIEGTGAVFDNVPDTAIASQYMLAVCELAMGRAGFYTDTGASPTSYVLDPANTSIPGPSEYYDGMTVAFLPNQTSALSGVTVNVGGLGATTLFVDADYGYRITAGVLCVIRLDTSGGDTFHVIDGGGVPVMADQIYHKRLARTTTDQSKTSNTVYTAVPGLNNAISVGQVNRYEFEAYFALTSGGIDGGITLRLSAPADCEWFVSATASGPSAASAKVNFGNGNIIEMPFVPNVDTATVSGIHMKGVLITDFTTGDVGIEFKQNVSDPVASTIGEGSYIKLVNTDITETD